MHLDTTFSNNPKVGENGSFQLDPAANGEAARNPPQTGATATGTLGYDTFFRDSRYHLTFALPHTGPALAVAFGSSLFEGEGTADESWGLADVVVHADVSAGRAPALP